MSKHNITIENETFESSPVINNSVSNEASRWVNGTNSKQMAPQSTVVSKTDPDSAMETDDSCNSEALNIRINRSASFNDDRPWKRIKLDNKPSDPIGVKNILLKWKTSKLSYLRDSYNEHLFELCYLNHDQNMLDLHSWKRKPSEDVVKFFQKRRLEGDPYIEMNLIPNQVPNEPAMVTPGDTQISSNTLKSNRIVLGPPNPDTTINQSSSQQDQILEKAKHEAYVVQRIGALRKEGLWTEKRLPKVTEPARLKIHWDYLIEEMVWLSADFAQERKWKKAAAKKCAKMVHKYFQDKTLQAQRAEKEQEMKLKKIAAFAAKEVRIFWSNIGKIVEYKVNTRLDAKKKMALDQHLSFIVDQTEKYSSMLAESMRKPEESAPSLNSDTASRTSSVSDAEFEPDGPSEDDEATIAREEDNPEEQASEVKLLQLESEQSLEDLLSDLPKEYFEQTNPKLEASGLRESLNLSPEGKSNCIPESLDVEMDDEDFKALDFEEDDLEDTIAEQEQAEANDDYTSELQELQDENEMSVEELRKKYAMLDEQTANLEESQEELDVDDSEECSQTISKKLNEQKSIDTTVCSDEEMLEDTDNQSDLELEPMMNLEDLMDQSFEQVQCADPSKENNDKADKELQDAAAVAESLQPKGFTLSSTSVTTPVPILLKHTLREYQHVGLDWLVTMYEKQLNGILADEMGLGKTIQTIALLAHLACEKESWGPHLVVVPTSVMLNWEMEFKKWCPAFKILTYYGSQKERKMKRQGWTKPNAFHVCITSYKLVIQDHQSFRRKKWKYFILDEAQNIKNFKSQRWQLLLNFQTQRRLLLTGTPLQNNLMELWSLMHFLMPNIFASHREFREWFSNPVTGMIEGNKEYNDNIIRRLHKVLRPFILRRLKCEVEQQMPKKYEHIVMCRLSKRQRFLYEEFMSRTKTRETLSSGNFLSVINILMQLRKVCNHPNLFEPRPTISPFMMEPIVYQIPSIVWSVCDYDPLKHVDLFCMNLMLNQLEFCLTAFAAHRIRRFQAPNKLIEEIDSLPEPPPKCPAGKIKLHVRPSSQPVPRPQNSGPRPLLTVKPVSTANSSANVSQWAPGVRFQLIQYGGSYKAIPMAPGSTGGMIMQQTAQGPRLVVPQRTSQTSTSPASQSSVLSTVAPTSSGGMHWVQTSSGPLILTSPASKNTNTTASLGVTGSTAVTLLKRLQNLKGLQGSVITTGAGGRPVLRLPTASGIRPSMQLTNSITTTATSSNTASVKFSTAVQSSTGVAKSENSATTSQPPSAQNSPANSLSKLMLSRANLNDSKHLWNPNTKKESSKSIFYMSDMENEMKQARKDKLKFMAKQNTSHCHACPIYGSDLVEAVSVTLNDLNCAATKASSYQGQGLVYCRLAQRPSVRHFWNWTECLQKLVCTPETRLHQLQDILKNYVFCVPCVIAPKIQLRIHHPSPSKLWIQQCRDVTLRKELSQISVPLHPIHSRSVTQFPDPRLIQYDCGKLQILDKLLRQLKMGNHRVLIFTQMTRMLDVFEMFLNYHGHLYLRLDGTTKVEQRQILMERFNQDKRIFAFILSTRSGGVGVNLTGADTVIFYDSDWNPTMDAQAQDRCHRIGQTRDVHIYRLISEKTIEENILKKANQKRLLGDLAIEGGNFTTASLKKQTIHDLFEVDAKEQDASKRMSEVLEKAPSKEAETLDGEHMKMGAYESALAAAEDESDVQAAKTAKAEAAADLAEFDENIPLEELEGREELSKAEQEVNILMKQLNPIEKYALHFLEESDQTLLAEAERVTAEIEKQKHEWEQNRLQTLKEEEKRTQQLSEQELLTYAGVDARNKIWITKESQQMMPIWEPPTPPRHDNDIYVEQECLWYSKSIIPDDQLPPTVLPRDTNRRIKTDPDLLGSMSMDQLSRNAVQNMNHEDTMITPRTLFDQCSTVMPRVRQVKGQQDHKLCPQSSGQSPKWAVNDEWAMVQILLNVLKLPASLTATSPAQTTNWDLCANLVNSQSATYRSARQCKNWFEGMLVAREEKKDIIDSPPKKAIKKHKGAIASRVQTRDMNTLQLYQQDRNTNLSNTMEESFKRLKDITINKKKTCKSMFLNQSGKNPKHAQVLSEYHVNYDEPLSAFQVTANRAERIQRDKKNQENMQLSRTSHQTSQAVSQLQQQLQTTAGQSQGVSKVATSVVLSTATANALMSGPTLLTTSPMVTTAGTVRTAATAQAPAARTVTLQDLHNRTSTSQTQVVNVANLAQLAKLPTQTVNQRGVTVPVQQRAFTAQQVQFIKQQAHKIQSGKVIGTTTTRPDPQAIKRVQVPSSFQITGHNANGQKLQVSAVSAANMQGLAAIQVSQSGARTQLIKPGTVATINTGTANPSGSGVTPKGVARPVTTSEMNALIRRPQIGKAQLAQLLAKQRGLVGAKPGGNSMGLHLVHSNNATKHMTMQQFQQVLRHGLPQGIQQGSLIGKAVVSGAGPSGTSSTLVNQSTGIVQATLSSNPSTKLIPVTVGAQTQGIKQTIQVVSGGGTSGNIGSSIRPAGISLQGSTVRVANPALQVPISVAVRSPNSNQVRIQTRELNPQQQQNQHKQA